MKKYSPEEIERLAAQIERNLDILGIIDDQTAELCQAAYRANPESVGYARVPFRMGNDLACNPIDGHDKLLLWDDGIAATIKEGDHNGTTILEMRCYEHSGQFLSEPVDVAENEYAIEKSRDDLAAHPEKQTWAFAIESAQSQADFYRYEFGAGLHCKSDEEPEPCRLQAGM